MTTSGENTFLSYPRISLSSLFSLSTFPRHKFHLFEIFTISSEYLKEPPCPWPTSYPKMFVGSSWVDCVFKEKDKSPITLYNKFGPQDLKKDVSSSQAWDKEKIPSPYEESNLRPSDLCSDALPLSHKDS